jgi:hypothetical protein
LQHQHQQALQQPDVQPAPLEAHVLSMAAPPAGEQPAAVSTAAPAAAGGLLGQGSLSSSSGTTIAARAAEFAQRRVQDAIAAFEEADGSSKSMLRPLGMLRQAGHGGQVLQV